MILKIVLIWTNNSSMRLNIIKRNLKKSLKILKIM